MGQADSERFLRWFYDADNFRTGLWKRLSNIARYKLRDAWDADSQLDELIARLYKRAGNESHDLFPVPLPGIEALEDQPDYDDIARYSQAATRLLAKSSNRKADAEVEIDPRGGDILEGNAANEEALVIVPSAVSTLDTLVVANSLPAWSGTLRVIRRKLEEDDRLAEPVDMPRFLAFLDFLINDVESYSDWQTFAVTRGRDPLISEAEKSVVESIGKKGHELRGFQTRFHHAFWRTCGELILMSPAKLDVPEDVQHLSVFAGQEIGQFMRDHHAGMMRNRPRPFTPRGARFRVPNRVLLSCGRQTWWDNLARRTSLASPALRPPTPFVLQSSEVRNA